MFLRITQTVLARIGRWSSLNGMLLPQAIAPPWRLGRSNYLNLACVLFLMGASLGFFDMPIHNARSCICQLVDQISRAATTQPAPSMSASIAAEQPSLGQPKSAPLRAALAPCRRSG